LLAKIPLGEIPPVTRLSSSLLKKSLGFSISDSFKIMGCIYSGFTLITYYYLAPKKIVIIKVRINDLNFYKWSTYLISGKKS